MTRGPRLTLPPILDRDVRRTLLRLIVLGVLIVASIDFLAVFPSAIRDVRAKMRVQELTAVSDRRLAPAFNYDVSRVFVTEAQQLLPEHADYVFRTGPYASASMPITLTAAEFVSRYLLMPRRNTNGVAGAQWLLCYGCRLRDVRVPYRVTWREPDAHGLLIARLHP